MVGLRRKGKNRQGQKGRVYVELKLEREVLEFIDFLVLFRKMLCGQGELLKVFECRFVWIQKVFDNFLRNRRRDNIGLVCFKVDLKCNGCELEVNSIEGSGDREIRIVFME